MPLPGGPADKLGNRYELWWTVSQLVRILDGSVDNIRIEDPGVIKAEFVVSRGGRRELHQAKRSHTEGKWSLASLAADDVKLLQAIHTQLAGNDDRFIFVSACNARELGELADRARQAESPQEFENKFLAAKELNGQFKKLQKYWNNAPLAATFDILRRIEVRTMDERSIEEQVTWELRALFLSDPVSICSELRTLVEDSIHKTVTREAIITHLAVRGYQLRRLARLDAAGPLIIEVTTQYLADGRKRLIRNSLLPRAATKTLLDRISQDKKGGDSAITGKAGVGKSSCVIELVEDLRSRDIPVLAFRLDRLEPVSSTAEIGRQLGLEESPVLVLAAAAEKCEGVLVVDQLDAVSTISGRSAAFLEAVGGLLAEARGLRERVKLHVVVVCRSFDWDNDDRVRQMLSGQAKVEVAEFLPEEVCRILSAEHFRVELFHPRQLELLRVPENLSLFLNSRFDPASAPAFNTTKELFDHYWDAKRRTVASRTAPLQDQWGEVVGLLCDEMTRTQQLSVPKEKLDHFAPDYLLQMGSEGVITFDGRRYGFGYESFFDYCFARFFVTSKQGLIDFLTVSEQHLFRRAQVRQVLAYIRDSDRTRYRTEVRLLLNDSRIRMHLKDLVLTLLANVPDPEEDDWALLEPCLISVWSAVERGERSPDKFAFLVWHQVFKSNSWFVLLDRLGLVAGWLDSGNVAIMNMAVNYLRFHQPHAGDRVAELLEPYAGEGGEWRGRLRYIMEWSALENSRRFFDLFLRLIDNGTLDKARGPITVNSTFWDMLYGLAKARPDWIPEVIAHWLRRRLVIFQQKQANGQEVHWHDIFNDDDFGSEQLYEVAEKHPDLFAQHVLPEILGISEGAIYSAQEEPPLRDAVWPVLFRSEHPPIRDACLNALATALKDSAKEKPEAARVHIESLKLRNSFTANFLLLSLYTGDAEAFADEAVELLCEQPWRLSCGYSDSPYWVTMELIRRVAPACSAENRARLEKTLLNYSSKYEKKPEGRRRAGHSSFVLLSAVPENLRSKNAQTRFRELERKFGNPDVEPRPLHVYSVGSPIKKESGEKMTDEQWLRAIAKYRSEEGGDRWQYPEKGGAWELAGMLREFVSKEPERFARLSLRMPLGTNPVYIERVLDGLKGTAASTALKLDLCRKAFSESRLECGKAIADLLGSIKESLPDDAVEILHWLATEHPDPEKELWEDKAAGGQPYYGGDILTHGINTTRGRAAEAIRDLIFTDGSYVARFGATIDRLVEDRSIAVRSCAASILLAVAQHDARLALTAFCRLVTGDDRLLATLYVGQFISYNLLEGLPVLHPIVKRMLRSAIPNVSRIGARLASLSVLYHPTAVDLADEAIRGNTSQRLGVAEVAAANIAQAECRAWCGPRLLQLFNDEEPEVRREAASCFRFLKQESLEAYEDLIAAFCDSVAYQEDSFSILHLLEGSLRRLPGIACIVCEKFLQRFSDEARDIRTHRAADVHTVAKLIFRTYHQHQRDEWASRCLNLIDLMCLEGIQDVIERLEEFER